jgi:ABC-type glutathione transport system ATPase component
MQNWPVQSGLAQATTTPDPLDPAGRAAHATGGDSVVVLDEVVKRFGAVVAVERLNLQIRRGEFFSMLGPSGCGKTTTLRMIGGFEAPTEGVVYLDGKDVTDLPAYKRNVNTVFQSYGLFPHLSVFDNVAFGLRRKRVPGRDVERRVNEALELVSLAGYGKRTWPGTLEDPVEDTKENPGEQVGAERRVQMLSVDLSGTHRGPQRCCCRKQSNHGPNCESRCR